MSDSAVAPANTVDAKVLLGVLAQIKGGDFSARMPLEWTGVAGKVADGFNDVIIANQALEAELARVSRVVGKEGKLSQRVVLGGSTCMVALSGDETREGGLELLRAGAMAYVRKGITGAEIAQALEDALEAKAAQRPRA